MKKILVLALFLLPFTVRAQSDTTEVKEPKYLTKVAPMGNTFYNEALNLFQQRQAIENRINVLMRAIQEQAAIDSTYSFARIIEERKVAIYIKPNPKAKIE